jgi:CDP-glycerol glycerophosphotransferase (TagB/SpsB family)
MTLETYKVRQSIEKLSRKWPKTPSIIFYTPKRLEGNLKYAFLETYRTIQEYNLPVKVNFLTDNKEDYYQLRQQNLPAILWDTFDTKPLSSLLSASVVVDDGFMHDNPHVPTLLLAALKGAKHINLWHGTPIKKIHLHLIDQQIEVSPHLASIFDYCSSIDTLCLASPNHTKLFNEAFLAKRIKVTGYARNDVLIRELVREDYINVDLTLLENILAAKKTKKIYMYAPTWRDGKSDWLSKSDLSTLSEIITDLGGFFIFNPHPFEREQMEAKFKDIPNIHFQQGYDIYPILGLTDVLITDYSSIVFDYLLTNGAVVYYRPDHLQYIEKSRDLIPEQAQQTTFPIAENLPDLKKILQNLPMGLSAEQLAMQMRHNKFLDANSSKRTANVILSMTGCNIFKRFLHRIRQRLQPNQKEVTRSNTATWHEEWDFSKATSINNLTLTGFSQQEDWGRWTDGAEAIIQFPSPLPTQLIIFLDATPYGPNQGSTAIFSIGNSQASVSMHTNLHIMQLSNEQQSNEIKIHIPFATSPSDEGISEDRRKLGLAFKKMCITSLAEPIDE